MSFVYVWEYRVRPESIAAFEAAYGDEGPWARLFRDHAGYLGTELLHDAAEPNRWFTLDRWHSRADRDRCREAAATEFMAIDRACEALTVEERHIGDFESVDAHLADSAAATDAFADPLASRLRAAVANALPRLHPVPESRAARQPGPGVWSPKQLLGHLIDSASNNHQRFVRAQFCEDLVFEGYEQDGWVDAQHYAVAPWNGLVELWSAFNRHLARIVETIPAEVRHRPRERHNLDRIAFRDFEHDTPVTLDAFMADYVDHLEHHLRQLFERLDAPADS